MLGAFRSSAIYIGWFVILTFVVVFVFAETSGLTSRGSVTRGTVVAKVNGTTITYDQWMRAREARIQAAQQQNPGQLSLDDEQRIEDATFNSMVNDILLQQELKRRGITITNQEIRDAAMQDPPPQFIQSPEFQTNGQFDPEKYRRFLSSPIAKEQGVLYQLEQYYRSELPRQKLFAQIAAPVYVSDAQLWRVWQDTHDSVQVSYVRFDPELIPDSAVHVTDAEIKQYFDAHAKDFPARPGRAVVSITMIPRTITKADTQRVYQHALALRKEIEGGAKFADVAKRESADTASAAKGGLLGRVTPGEFVPAFDSVAFALKPGVLSAPVLTPFGYHLIEVDSRKGDTIAVRHILLRIQQGDSSAAVSDREADSLAHAAGAEHGAVFDSVTRTLGLKVSHAVATEGQPLAWNGRSVPSVSAWAFTARVGETSDLIDSPGAYYLARLDSLTPGGKATLTSERDAIERKLVREKKLDLLMPRAQAMARAVAGGKTLAAAARAAGQTVSTTPMFARVSPVPGLGQATRVIGAAFALPTGDVSEPVKTSSAVFLIRVDKKVAADHAAWEKQKATQRQQVVRDLQQQRVQQFLADLRANATIEDHRKEIEQQTRAASG